MHNRKFPIVQKAKIFHEQQRNQFGFILGSWLHFTSFMWSFISCCCSLGMDHRHVISEPDWFCLATQFKPQMLDRWRRSKLERAPLWLFISNCGHVWALMVWSVSQAAYSSGFPFSFLFNILPFHRPHIFLRSHPMCQCNYLLDAVSKETPLEYACVWM